jgi:signal transduction histidine kinase
MENLLSKRSKNLDVIVGIVSSGFIILAAVLYLFLFKQPHLDDTVVREAVLSNLKSIESTLERKISDYKKRAEFIFSKYQQQQLQHSELDRKEALIIIHNGIIKEYYGEIYYFKLKTIDTHDWGFIEKRKALFFMQKMAENIFYVRYFFHLDNNFVLDQLKYDFAIKELNSFNEKKIDKKSTFHYDKSRDLFSYSYLLKSSNNWLSLYLRFSENDIKSYYKKREQLFLFAILFGFLLMAMGYFYKKKRVLSRILWFGLLLELFVFVSRVVEKNLYLRIGNITFYSIYEILIILIAVLSLIYWIRDKLKLKIAAYLLFNLTLLVTLNIGNTIFRAVNFNYTEFTIHYLTLVMVIFLLHLLPIFFIRHISFKKSLKHIGGVLLVQTLVLIVSYYLLRINFVNVLLMSIIAMILLFFKRKFLVRVGVIFLIAISIFFMAGRHAMNEKKEFIADNLKDIFLNQNNYAKFIAREIVYQLNLESKNFHEFFQENSSSRLRTLWQRTMAYRENIPSGIFVVSPEGKVLNHHSYLMQFLEVKTRRIFPFWAIEDTTADLYGKKALLAVASINVVRKSKHLGRIIVQVLNSPELILRHQDRINIFTIDNKIRGTELSYIKLNEENQIVENPSNINLQNISEILKFNEHDQEKWMTFRFIDLVFNGYIFKHNKNTIIIFFPANTLFKDLSEIIKIFLFLLLLFFLFYFRDLGKLEWKSIYYSYSIRVFSLLILISLLTAIIFSLFSLDFNSQSSLRQSRQMIYERGRIAQNIGYSHLEEGEEFTPDHLLLISGILNTDVNVYEEGVLLDTSNYRKIINNQVANFLHSNILTLLNRKNQKFVLLDDENSYHLYFKIYEYILDVEFSYGWREILSEETYYTNFIITLFFILTIIGFSSAFFFRNKILSPINDLNKGMAEVEKGNLHQLKTIPSEIEIKNLYMGFNAMIEGIKEQKKNISEISRMKTIIKLGRRVAHEVKNPLTPIKLSAEQILKALKDKNPNYENIIKQSINYIIDETEHLKKVSYGFLDLSKLDELSPKQFDLLDLTRKEVFNYRQIYSHIDFYINEETDTGSFMVTLDKFKLKQVLKNLIINSIEAIGEKEGEVRINLKRSKNSVSIEVKDNGIGIEEEALDLIYNVDYSTKKIGTGLGLFIVKRIIDLHKGHIHVESEKNRGTRVVVELPAKIE